MAGQDGPGAVKHRVTGGGHAKSAGKKNSRPGAPNKTRKKKGLPAAAGAAAAVPKRKPALPPPPPCRKVNQLLKQKPASLLAVVSSNWKAIAPEKTLAQTHQRHLQKQREKQRHKQTAAAAAEPAAAQADDAVVPEVWFDGVSKEDLVAAATLPSGSSAASARHPTTAPEVSKAAATSSDPLVTDVFDKATKHVAMDCEMVGVGEDGDKSILARCSIVNRHGHVLFDSFVKPRERVTDLRTRVSGVRWKDLANAPSFEDVQKKAAELIKGRIVVGHSLKNDFKALLLDHPRHDVRDTALYKPLQEKVGKKRPSLKMLAKTCLGMEIQQGEHSSVQDARVAMAIYRQHGRDWEVALSRLAKRGKKGQKRSGDDAFGEDAEAGDEPADAAAGTSARRPGAGKAAMSAKKRRLQQRAKKSAGGGKRHLSQADAIASAMAEATIEFGGG